MLNTIALVLSFVILFQGLYFFMRSFGIAEQQRSRSLKLLSIIEIVMALIIIFLIKYLHFE